MPNSTKFGGISKTVPHTRADPSPQGRREGANPKPLQCTTGRVASGQYQRGRAEPTHRSQAVWVTLAIVGAVTRVPAAPPYSLLAIVNVRPVAQTIRADW